MGGDNFLIEFSFLRIAIKKMTIAEADTNMLRGEGGRRTRNLENRACKRISYPSTKSRGEGKWALSAPTLNPPSVVDER